MSGALLSALLVLIAVMLGFVALWRIVTARDPLEARLSEYGRVGELPADAGEGAPVFRRRWPLVTRLANGFGLGPRLARELARADWPMTAAEFVVIVVVVGALMFLLGLWRGGPILGVALAAVGGFLPVLYLRGQQGKRKRAFTQQLPDVLTMLVGALRAGYGLSQAFDVLVKQLPPPSSTEFARVLRAMTLGVPVQQALDEMAGRIGSDDADLVVTAINVQYEMGGNLAQTLDIIGETVRDRIRMLREIQVLTSRQRLTGYILAALPVFVILAMLMSSPGYIRPMFQPGLPRLLLIVAVLMQVAGFLVIRWILDIEV